VIQSAAHEDCNIIFGAVLDERMGDEVKITVIATGFRQDMPERRARMLAESTLPGADYQVPIRPQSGGRGVGTRASEAPPMFASEEREARQAPRMIETAQMPLPRAEAVAEASAPAVVETEMRAEGPPHANRVWVRPQEMDDVDSDLDSDDWSGEESEAPAAEAEAEFDTRSEDSRADAVEAEDAGCEVEPELVPVAASVFDDEFFRAPYAGGRAAGEDAVFGGAAAIHAAPAAAPAAEMRTSWDPGGEREMWTGRDAAPAGDVRLFAGASASHAEHRETDELDIPAFLRRSR
jgi:cell division protein FtsZ